MSVGLEQVFIDPSEPPAIPTDQDFTDEIAKEQHLDQYGSGPIPMIITPPGVTPAYNLANGGCAYHNWGSEPTSPVTSYYAWAVVPYELISSAGCQPTKPVKIGTSGTLSMIAGHEWAETVVNPFPGATLGGNTIDTAWMAQVLNPQGQKVLTEMGTCASPLKLTVLRNRTSPGSPSYRSSSR